MAYRRGGRSERGRGQATSITAGDVDAVMSMGRRPASAEGRQHGIPRQGAAARPHHYSAGVDAEGGAVAKYLSR